MGLMTVFLGHLLGPLRRLNCSDYHKPQLGKLLLGGACLKCLQVEGRLDDLCGVVAGGEQLV